jgi:type III pantothenate kinase
VILVFDVGNTETTIGLFEGEELRAHWRIMTDVARTPDEFVLLLRALMESAEVPRSAVHGAAIGSVVPPITAPLAAACRQSFSATALIVDARSPLPIRLDVDEPMTVGADRLINTLAASRIHRRDTIVVDLGTATTFDCITADSRFIGGVIMPGLRTSSDQLTRRTAKLPATELKAPARVIGRRTEECIQAGVLYGTADAVDGIVRRIRAEWPGGGSPRVVATGGLAPVVAPLTTSIEQTHPDLTLQGLRIAAGLLGLKW